MIRRIIVLAGLLFLSSQVLASDWMINSYRFCTIGSTASVSFVATTINTSDLQTYTFNTASMGAEDCTRKTIIEACANDNAGTFSVTGIEIDDVAISEVPGTDTNSAGNVNCAIYIGANPTGTTAKVDVTFSEAMTSGGAAIMVFAAYDLQSMTAVDSAMGYSSNNSDLTLSLNTTNGGIAVGVAGYFSGNINQFTWTGLTERSDTGSTSTAVLSIGAADATTTTQTPRAVTLAGPGGGNNAIVGATASFR